MPWLSHRRQGLSSYSPGLTALKWGRHGTYLWCIFCLATHDIGMSSPHKTCFSQDNKAVFSQCENRRADIAQCHAINTSSVHLLGWYSRAITFGYTITFGGYCVTWQLLCRGMRPRVLLALWKDGEIGTMPVALSAAYFGIATAESWKISWTWDSRIHRTCLPPNVDSCGKPNQWFNLQTEHGVARHRQITVRAACCHCSHPVLMNTPWTGSAMWSVAWIYT